MMSYKKARWKLQLELILMWPFVALGRLYGRIHPLKSEVDIFFFFPNADIGGSPKVNLDIVDCIKEDKKCLIVFSKKPKNNLFKDRFEALGVPILDLQARIDNKFFHFVNFFYRGVIASWINQQPQPTILGGECIFLYKIVPHLSKRVKTIELIHLATWLRYSKVFASYLDIRLFSTLQLMREMKKVYQSDRVPACFEARFQFIDNCIEIPSIHLGVHDPVEVIFVGRGTKQKRPELIARIAEVLYHKNAPVHFSFVGDVDLVFDPKKYPFCKFYGNISKEQELLEIYANADILMLTSAFEGLPIVVMQMMAYGKVVVSTAVGGIPDYIVDGENGYLITEKEEAQIIVKGVQIIENLLADKAQMQRIGANNYEKAKRLFGRDVFCRNIKALLNPQ